MVYLNKIYTKTGDTGETSLGDGTRVSKSHPRITAFGSVDELNSAIGMALAIAEWPSETKERLQSIQNDLFDLGADLCVPITSEPGYTPLRITAGQAKRLEDWIDEANEHLEPLTSFILPGGSRPAAALHVARTVCRRAESDVVRLIEAESRSEESAGINLNVMIYLNRLSDLLFVMARAENDSGKKDVLWKPGASQT